MQRSFDAIVLAGYDPNRPHPLMAGQAASNKALLPVDGQPMIVYVVQALASSGVVDRIVVPGLEPTGVVDEAVHGSGCELHYLPNRPSMFANAAQAFHLLAGFQDSRRHVFVTSADVPLLTGGIVASFLDSCKPYTHDAYWGIVGRPIMEATFPASRRTYLRLVEGEFCNGELYLARIEVALRQQAVLDELIELRKNVVRQALRLGPKVLLKLVLRRLTVTDLIGVAQRVLGIQGMPVMLPFAESGMDVDKPHQLAQVEAYLQRRDAGAGQERHA